MLHNQEKIEALHEFQDPRYAQEWAEKFSPTKDRRDLFEAIDRKLRLLRPGVKVLELGIGPGYLAKFLLDRWGDFRYEGLDFSKPMLEIARQRTSSHQHRIHLTQADLTQDTWTDQLGQTPDVVVSTWALHDLLSKHHIHQVYQSVYALLASGGVLLNGDFVKPEQSTLAYEGGRIKPSEHLDLLTSAGFTEVAKLQEFEKNVANPTTANNYVLFYARK